MNLILGGSAGTCALTCTYPTDLIRRKMQLRGTGGHENYDSMLDCFQKILKNEGVAGLYKGYFAALLKVAPSVAILFWCNEVLKGFLIK